MTTVANRLISGSLLQSSNLIISVVISFFMMPFMVGQLGDRMYGVWTIVAEFLWYYGLLDFGLSSAIGRYLSQAVGRKDTSEIKKLTSTTFILTLGLGLISLVLTALLVLILPKFVQSSDLQLFQILLVVLGINFALEFPVRVFNSVLGSHLRFDLAMTCHIIKNIVTALLIYVILINGYGVLGVAIVTFITSFLDSAALVYFAFRIEPNISLSLHHYSKGLLKKLFDYSLFSFMGKVADILRFKIDLFVITFFIGLSAVTHYFIAARLLDYVMRFIVTVIEVMGPVFSREEGKNDFDSIREKFLTVTKVSIYLAIFCGTLAIFYGQPFIERWMGEAYLDSYHVLVILMIPAMVALLQNPSEHLLYGISKHKFLAWTSLGEGLLNLTISLLLVQRYGILGVALGTAIPMSIRFLILPFYVCRTIQLPLGTYFGVVLRHVLGSILILTGVWFLSKSLIQPSYPILIGIFFVASVVFWPSIFLVGFNSREKNYAIQYLRRSH